MPVARITFQPMVFDGPVHNGPGAVVLAGALATSIAVRPGDHVEIARCGFGVLSNPVRSR